MLNKTVGKHNQIPSIWSKVHPQTAPIIHVQINRLKYHLRLHWLPNSKQYPESVSEYDEIKSRLIKLLSCVYGENISLKCVITIFNSDQVDIENVAEINNYIYKTLEIKDLEILESINLGKQADLTNFYDDDNESPVLAKFLVTKSSLNHSHFANITKATVNGRLFNTFFMCEEIPAVVAIYEGGFDLIVSTESEKQILMAEFQDWLPKEYK